jgi:hypothetical protein
VAAAASGQACSTVLTFATGSGGQPGVQATTPAPGVWLLRGQTGIGGQPTIAVPDAPPGATWATGHGSGRQSITVEPGALAGVAHGTGGQVTPVDPVAPLAAVPA